MTQGIQKTSAAEEVISDLRARGFRITKVRRAIASELIAAGQPRSALELLEALKVAGLNVNKTTVYRELDFLQANRIVTEIDLLDGMKRYEMVLADHHHHHLVCTQCKNIQCVEMDNDLDELERRLQKRHGFRVESHVLEFFGICSGCHSSGPDVAMIHRGCRH